MSDQPEQADPATPTFDDATGRVSQLDPQAALERLQKRRAQRDDADETQPQQDES